MPAETVAHPAAEHHGKAKAFLRINNDLYELRRLRRNHWTLWHTAGDRSAYHAMRLPGGAWSCTCADHLHRTVRCKHVGALMACGLLPKVRARKAVANV